MAKPKPRKTPAAAKRFASQERNRRAAPRVRRQPITRYNPIHRPIGDAGQEVGRGTPPPSGQGGPPGGGGSQTQAPPPTNTFFPGMPQDLANQIAEYLRTHPGDEDGAMALIRASQWYSHEYAGIQYGVQHGLFDAQNPEADYRAWKNQAMDIYSRYYGQPMSEQQLSLYLYNGWTPQRIEQIGQGASWVKSQGGEAQYALGAFGSGKLTQEQLYALGRQEAGLQSDMGQQLHDQLQLALQKVQKVFSGGQGTGFGLNQSLSDIVQKRQQSDIGA